MYKHDEVTQTRDKLSNIKASGLFIPAFYLSEKLEFFGKMFVILYIVGIFSAYATKRWGHPIHFQFTLQGARYLQGHIFLYNFC